MLYADLRYEGGNHGGTGAAEPDLILTDDETLVASSNTGSNEPVAYMGMRAVLLQWHLEDPVDDRERQRNDVVYGFQGNRNPFIDHAEWVACLFKGACAIGTPYCSGDGSASACPCGNTGAVGAGCANGSFAAGCELSSAGSASLSAGDLVLLAASSTPSQPGLFFQGDNQVNFGDGLPFGDGLRCAGGVVWSTLWELRFTPTGAFEGLAAERREPAADGALVLLGRPEPARGAGPRAGRPL